MFLWRSQKWILQKKRKLEHSNDENNNDNRKHDILRNILLAIYNRLGYCLIEEGGQFDHLI